MERKQVMLSEIEKEVERIYRILFVYAERLSPDDFSYLLSQLSKNLARLRKYRPGGKNPATRETNIWAPPHRY